MINAIYGGIGYGKTNCLLESMTPYVNNLYITNQAQVLYIEKEMARRGIQGRVTSYDTMGAVLFADIGIYDKRILQYSEELMILHEVIKGTNLKQYKELKLQSTTLRILLDFCHDLQKEDMSERRFAEFASNSMNDTLKALSVIYSGYESYLLNHNMRSPYEAALYGVYRLYVDATPYDHIAVDVLDEYHKSIKVLVDKCAESRERMMDIALLSERQDCNIQDLAAYENTKMIEDIFKISKGQYVNATSLKSPMPQSEGIKLTKLFFFDKRDYSDSQFRQKEGVSLHEFTSVSDEIDRAAGRISELISLGCNPSDIVVCVSDDTRYMPGINISFSRYGISYSAKERKSLLETDIYTFMNICCDVARKGEFTGTEVLRLCNLPFMNINSLEQSYLKRLFVRFGNNLAHVISASENFNDETEQQIVIPLLLRMFNEINPIADSINIGMVEDVLRKMLEFFKRKSVNEYYRAQAQELKDNGLVKESDAVIDMWKSFNSAIKQVIEFQGTKKASVSEFLDIITGVFENTFTSIPSYTSDVRICGVDTAKLVPCKHLFVLGANEGIFPSKISQSLLSDDEIYQIRDTVTLESTQKATQIATGNIYLTMCHPSESLNVSWSTSFQGKPAKMAVLMTNMHEIFETTHNYANEESRYIALLEALVRYRRFGDKSDALNDFNYFKSKEDYAYRLRQDIKHISIDYRKFNDDTDSILDCYKSRDTLAITELEQFNQCPFAHFIKYGLRPKELKKYQESPADAGNYYHEVMAEFFKRIRLSNILTISQNDCYTDVEKICNDIEQKHNDNYLESDAGSRYLKDLMRKNIKNAAWAAVRQLQSGDFVVNKVETMVGIGADKELSCANGKIHLVGKIDRYDVLNDKYARVIDYKSGSTRYNKESFEAGIQLQLPLYIKALDDEYMSAGMYYMPISVSAYKDKDKDINSDSLKGYQLSGPTLEDRNILAASDNSLSDEGVKSEIINAEITKKGEISARSSVLSEQDFENVKKQALKIAENTALKIFSGETKAFPLKTSSKNACSYCSYKHICRFDPTGDDKYRTL